MVRKKTHEEFVAEVEALVGDEYEVLGEYSGSPIPVKMKHEACGDIYTIRPNDFLRRRRCPKCAISKRAANQIKLSHEDFEREIYKLVGNEYDVLSKYQKRSTNVMMRHENCQQTFEANPDRFFRGARCPICTLKNSAKIRTKTHSTFVKDVEKIYGNDYLIVSQYEKSNKKMDVTHNICGHNYKVTPNNLLSGSRCPKCFATYISNGQPRKKRTFEIFTEEVKSLVGTEYAILSTFNKGGDKVTMRHDGCGDIFETTPNQFISGSRCHKCGGSKKKTTEIFVEEARIISNDEYSVLGEYVNAKTKIQIMHDKCGNTFKVMPANFLNGSRCPTCNESKGERRIKEWLTTENTQFIVQECIYYSDGKYPLRLDFYVQGIAIEYDGVQHFKPIERFGGETALRETQRRDAIKTKFCADNGIPLIRIPYWEYDNIDAILTEKLLPLLNNADKLNAS